MSLGTHSFGYEKLRKHRVDLFCFLNHVWQGDIHICLKDKDSQPEICALAPEWLGWLCVTILIKNDQTIFISCSFPLFPKRSSNWNSKRNPQIFHAHYSHLHPHLDAFYCFPPFHQSSPFVLWVAFLIYILLDQWLSLAWQFDVWCWAGNPIWLRATCFQILRSQIRKHLRKRKCSSFSGKQNEKNWNITKVTLPGSWHVLPECQHKWTYFYNFVVAFPLIHNLEGHLVCSIFITFSVMKSLKAEKSYSCPYHIHGMTSDLSPWMYNVTFP